MTVFQLTPEKIKEIENYCNSIYDNSRKAQVKDHILDASRTGREINLQGKVSAIGGLELKILGGIKAGIKTFIFPEENKKDYKKFIEKYKDKHVYNDDITFKSVKNIKEVLDIVFV